MAYISSSDIKMYPTARRDDDFDRNARLNTEQNLVSIINRLTNIDSFVIQGLSIENGSLTAGSCNIHGYVFNILNDLSITVSGNSSNNMLALQIRIKKQGDVEELIAKTSDESGFSFERCAINALHPGVSAVILHNQEKVGYIGQIHPQVQKKLGLKQPVFLFEMKLSSLSTRKLPVYTEISKFPSIKRDLAIVLDSDIAVADILKAVRNLGGDLVIDATIFDIYQGEGLPEGKKSIAFSITLQTADRTLEDNDVIAVVEKICAGLNKDFGATLRE